MNNDEEKIEEFLKKSVGSVKAPRAIFDYVTKEEFNRNIIKRDPRPSPYQLNNFFMKKNLAFIGAVAVVAVLVLVGSHKGEKREVASNDMNTSVSSLQEDTSVKEVSKPSSKQSVDSITADIGSDGDSDLAYAGGESEDEMAMNSELDAFINLKNTSYENNI